MKISQSIFYKWIFYKIIGKYFNNNLFEEYKRLKDSSCYVVLNKTYIVWIKIFEIIKLDDFFCYKIFGFPTIVKKESGNIIRYWFFSLRCMKIYRITKEQEKLVSSNHVQPESTIPNSNSLYALVKSTHLK